MEAGHGENRNDPAVPRGSKMSLRTSLALLLAAASFVFVAAYAYVHSPFNSGTNGYCPLKGKGEVDEGEDKALAVPDDEDERNEEVERPGGVGISPGSTTGQRVAGHLLAVLLMASVTAAIVEAVRARMSRSTVQKGADPGTPGTSDAHHHRHSPSAGGRTSRRGTLQEKSYSYDGYIYRSRSSSAGVSNQQVSVSASAAAAAFRAQKAMKVRMGGRTGGTPPLLRRSSFPVMSRTMSRGDSNGGSPALGSRKPSISDIGDDEMGELQKKRVRLIRRF